MVFHIRLPRVDYILLVVTLTILAITVNGCGALQTTHFQSLARLDAAMVGAREEIGTVGMAAALVKGEELVWAGGYGQANVEQQSPVTTDSVFLVASIAKTVTAVAVMQLVEAGQMDLDADINGYLPFDVAHPNSAEPITARQLLTHTSGLVDNHYWTIVDSLYTVGSDSSLSLEEYLGEMLLPAGRYYNQASFGEAPGKAFAYSNLGYTLLGYAVERVAGVPFDAWTQQKIFAPLGMSRTAWRLAQLPATALVMPYSADRTPYGHYTFPDYPNGGLRTTVNDLSRFLRAIALGGELNGQRILKPETVTEMLRVPFPMIPGAELQSHGWDKPDPTNIPDSVGLSDIGSVIGHTGGERGVYAVMYMNPTTQVGAIVAINTDPSKDEQIIAVYRTAVNLVKLGERP